MRQLANILHENPAATQTAVVAPTLPPPSASSSAGKYLSDTDADTRLQHAKAIGAFRSSPAFALRVWIYLRKLARDAGTGEVRMTNTRLGRLLGGKDRNTVGSALKLLEMAGLLQPPCTTHDTRGYITGLLYRPIVTSTIAVIPQQHVLPLKCITKSSSARCAPRSRPLEPATTGHVQKTCWDITNELRDAQARGEDVADSLPDVAQAVRQLLTERAMTASEAAIRAGLDHVERQRQRQQLLPLVGAAPGNRGRRRYVTRPSPDIARQRLFDQHLAALDALKARRA